MKKILFAALFLCITQLGFASGANSRTNSVSVSGTVIDASTKKPLADVTIIAVNGSNKSEAVTTNAQGQFKITSLPQGTYTLKFAKEDYKNIDKKEVSIKTEGTTKVTIEMVAETLEANSHRSWWDKYDLFR
jgi:5-hydroxyisourate hydrolase-like protein (transthyretin family)